MSPLPRAFPLAAATLLVIAAIPAGAQTTAPLPTPSPSRWELRLPGGAFVATGAQGEQLKDGQVTAVQLSRLLSPRVALVGTFAWARSRDLTRANAPKLDVFTSDVGLEGRSNTWLATSPVSVRAFAGLGAGARSYNHRALDVAATHHVAGYLSVGSDLDMGRVGLRLEARDYSSRRAAPSGTRNDIVLMAALRFIRGSKSNRQPAEAR